MTYDIFCVALLTNLLFVKPIIDMYSYICYDMINHSALSGRISRHTESEAFMNISILYLLSFIASVLILLYAVTNGEGYSTNQVLAVAVTVVGNGGYLALSRSQNLEEALLANKITYVMGIFLPMLLFIVICEILRIDIPVALKIIMYSVQFVLYFGVVSIGYSDIFYKSAEYHLENGIVYLSKTYGPLHTGYIVTMYAYLLGVIIVLLVSTVRKNIIGSRNISVIFFLEFLTMSSYIAERIIHLRIELVPIVDLITLSALMVPLSKIHTFSLTGRNDLIRRRIDSAGFIMFDRRMRYMGCNTFAADIFPELLQWEPEKKVPGSGGRFNTYLRQSLMGYVQSCGEISVNTFNIKDKVYISRIGSIKNRFDRLQGYMIELEDITDTVTHAKGEL